MSARLPPVNFTGSWVLDSAASDSLEPLIRYHAAALTPTAVSTQPTDQMVLQQRLKGKEQAAAIVNALQRDSKPVVSAARTLSSVAEEGTADSSSSSNNSSGADVSASTAATTTDTSAIATSPAASAPTSSPASTSPTSSAAAATAAATAVAAANLSIAVPAMIIQHSPRRFLSYLHTLIPRYGADGKLLRYDPLLADTPLQPHETYKIDHAYHRFRCASIAAAAALARGASVGSSATEDAGIVESRAYPSPDLQRLVVDTRCASKYDLERTERRVENEGKTMVVDIRILTCAPEGEEEETQQTQQMQIREVLHLKRVYRRLLDAAPQATASPSPIATATTAAATTATATTTAASSATASTTTNSTAKITTHTTFTTSTVASINGNVSSASTASPPAAAAISSSSTASAHLPPVAKLLIEQLTAPSPPASTTLWPRLRSFLFPRSIALKHYHLSDLVTAQPQPPLPQQLQEAVAADQRAYDSATQTTARLNGALVLLLARVAWSLGSDAFESVSQFTSSAFALFTAATGNTALLSPQQGQLQVSGLPTTLTTPPPSSLN